jgi:hypothetical protein
MMGLGKARALPWTREGADGPFDPMNIRLAARRWLLGPFHRLGRPLLATSLIPGFQGPPALGGARGSAPALLRTFP